MIPSKNVYGNPLIPCSTAPMTGFYRDGCCNTGADDRGIHTVCAVMTDEFLQYSKQMGNDLTTPLPHYNFPGLKPGDRWCLCVLRWKEALDADLAPPVVLEATHQTALQYVSLEDLEWHALEKNA